MMSIFMVGFGLAIVAMIVGIGRAVSKDVIELIDFVHDTDNSLTNGPRRV